MSHWKASFCTWNRKGDCLPGCVDESGHCNLRMPPLELCICVTLLCFSGFLDEQLIKLRSFGLRRILNSISWCLDNHCFIEPHLNAEVHCHTAKMAGVGPNTQSTRQPNRSQSALGLWHHDECITTSPPAIFRCRDNTDHFSFFHKAHHGRQSISFTPPARPAIIVMNTRLMKLIRKASPVACRPPSL